MVFTQLLRGCSSLDPSGGRLLLFRQEKTGREGGSLKRREGLTSREDRVADTRGFSRPTSPSGKARTIVLVPRAGGCSISRQATRPKLPSIAATALPRKTAWRAHADPVSYGSRRPPRTKLLEPNAGAEGLILTLSLEILRFAFFGSLSGAGTTLVAATPVHQLSTHRYSQL